MRCEDQDEYHEKGPGTVDKPTTINIQATNIFLFSNGTLTLFAFYMILNLSLKNTTFISFTYI